MLTDVAQWHSDITAINSRDSSHREHVLKSPLKSKVKTALWSEYSSTPVSITFTQSVVLGCATVTLRPKKVVDYFTF